MFGVTGTNYVLLAGCAERLNQHLRERTAGRGRRRAGGGRQTLALDDVAGSRSASKGLTDIGIVRLPAFKGIHLPTCDSAGAKPGRC